MIIIITKITEKNASTFLIESTRKKWSHRLIGEVFFFRSCFKGLKPRENKFQVDQVNVQKTYRRYIKHQP